MGRTNLYNVNIWCKSSKTNLQKRVADLDDSDFIVRTKIQLRVQFIDSCMSACAIW